MNDYTEYAEKIDSATSPRQIIDLLEGMSIMEIYGMLDQFEELRDHTIIIAHIGDRVRRKGAKNKRHQEIWDHICKMADERMEAKKRQSFSPGPSF